MKLTRNQLKHLTIFLMVCDSPDYASSHQSLSHLANQAAKEHGFKDWVEAYHQLDSSPSKAKGPDRTEKPNLTKLFQRTLTERVLELISSGDDTAALEAACIVRALKFIRAATEGINAKRHA